MRRAIMTTSTDRLKASALLLAVVLAAGVLVVGTRSAEAAFPKANGKIVFYSNRVTATNPTGDYEIYTMNPDGTGLTQLTDNTATDGGLTFSPDGTKIAFVSERDGNFEIYTMEANGSNQTNRSNNTATDDLPDWQPLP